MDLVILACMLSCSCTALAGQEPANLVANPSFEQPDKTAALPAGWNGDPRVYSADPEARHSGRVSLRFVNQDPKRYCLCSQRIPLRPGSKCRFSAWIKTKDITGNDSGASVCLEWQDKKGEWLGGRYPTGLHGANDWTCVEETTRVPEEAVSCSITCYVREGMTGTAWFDDVEVARIVDPPMQTMLRSPMYRGRITSAGPAAAQVQVRLTLTDYDLKPADLRLEVRLRDTAGKFRWESTFVDNPASGGRLDIKVPVRGLPVGRYELELRLLGPDRL